MLTILSAYVCLHGVCTQVTIPTPASLDAQSCEHQGYWLSASYVSSRWRVVGYECSNGRMS